MSETFVFVYLGINVTGAVWSSFFKFQFDPLLIFLCVLLCFISRAVGVYGLYGLANLKRKKRVPWNFQVLQWWAGLRGAVAFSLALNVTTENKDTIISTTLMIVLFTILGEGSLTAPLIRFLKVDKKRLLTPEGIPLRESMEEELLAQQELAEANARSDSPAQDKAHMSAFHMHWRKFDERIVKPYFGGKPRSGF